jgi:hypothetical protein
MLWRSGLRNKPGVPRTGWQRCSEIDFEAPEANCDWCGRAIRYVNLMTHPDWQDSVRVGRVCAICMSRRRRFLLPSAGRDLQHHEFRQHALASVCWALIVMVILAFLVGVLKRSAVTIAPSIAGPSVRLGRVAGP